MINIGSMLGAISNKGGASVSTMPISPGELDKFKQMMAQYKSQYKPDGPPKIQDLSAYSLNQVQQSLDKYNKTSESYRGKNAWEQMDFPGDPNNVRDWNKEEASRAKYKKGSWGIEDEYRWMQEENNFLGDFGNMGIGNGNGNGMPQIPPGLKPGDKGYNFQPNNNYNGTQGSGLPGRNGAPGIAGAQQQQAGSYDYSGYDAGALGRQVKGSGQVSTGFYNKAYGQSVEQGEKMFGMADLEGNLGAGITATQLKEFFDGGGGASLGANQQAGTGGIYDQVAAAAEAEKKVETQELPAPKKPGTMNIGPAMVGNGGNASGVRTKRSNDSKYGRNTRGTSQFNRGSFGNSKTSALTIGGLNI